MHIPYYNRIGIALSALFLLAACHDDGQEKAGGAILQTEPVLQFNSACQIDTLQFTTTGTWTADCDAEWITLTGTQGNGDGMVQLYVQQNDDEAQRQATVRIHTENGDLSVAVSQDDNSNNGSPILNLTRDCGLGWGYDCSIDYADQSGIKGQIFDAAALRNDWGNNAIAVIPSSSTKAFFKKGTSVEELQTAIGGAISGGVDLKIASAKVSVAFNQQTTEQTNRFFAWCRDTRTVKLAYFGNDVDLYDEEVLKWCTTSSFRNAVKNNTPQDIVRKFGTHVVTASYLGGKLDYYFTVTQNTKTTVEQISTTINVKVLFISTSASIVDEKTWQEVKKSFEGYFNVSGGGDAGIRLNSELQKYANVGEPLTDPTLFEQWYTCFEDPATAKDEDLVMVNFSVTPIWEIITGLNPAKANAVEDYIRNTYLK